MLLMLQLVFPSLCFTHPIYQTDRIATIMWMLMKLKQNMFLIHDSTSYLPSIKWWTSSEHKISHILNHIIDETLGEHVGLWNWLLRRVISVGAMVLVIQVKGGTAMDFLLHMVEMYSVFLVNAISSWG